MINVAHEYPEPDGIFYISRRGIVVTYEDQTQPLVGDVVSIAGDVFVVAGIETHATIDRHKHRNFGLMIKPYTTDTKESKKMPDKLIMELLEQYEEECLEYSYQRANRSRDADRYWSALIEVKKNLLAAIDSQLARENS